MSGNDRAHWIAILDAAANSPPDEMNGEWTWLLDQLKLPADYFLAVYEAVKQGRWRVVKNPKAYVKTVAKREAFKLGIASDSRNDELVLVNSGISAEGRKISHEDVFEALAYQSDASEAVKGTDGVWRRGGGFDFEYPDWSPEFESLHDSLMSQFSDGLKLIVEPTEELKTVIDEINNSMDDFHVHLQTSVLPNWEKWCEIAGFDSWERRVVSYRCQGVSRDKALAEQPDEVCRKALQAAWKRFDRTGMGRLRRALEKVAS